MRYPNALPNAMACNHTISMEARIVLSIIERWAAVAGEPDGEDTAGRSKLRLQEPAEVVDRACEVAKAAVDAFEARGWIAPPPPLEHVMKLQALTSDSRWLRRGDIDRHTQAQLRELVALGVIEPPPQDDTGAD